MSKPSSTSAASPEGFALPGSAVVVLPFDRDQLPPGFRDYPAFVQHFGYRRGNVVCYRRRAQGDEVVYSLDTSAEESRAMSVRDWHAWYETNEDAIKKGTLDTLLYLCNIEVDDHTHDRMRRNYPDTIGSWHEGGKHCLARFISAFSKHIPQPCMRSRLYLSPPTPGGIVTPPHLDGHGTQSSLHVVLFGRGCHNIVQFWDRESVLTDAKAESEFRSIVGLVPVPKSKEDAHLPHDRDFSFRAAETGEGPWDVGCQTRLPVHLQGHRITAGPGQMLFLPAGTYHAFAKHHSGDSTMSLEPMLGYAGDMTYIGATTVDVDKHLDYLFRVCDIHRSLSLRVYCFPELAILCFFLLHGEGSLSKRDYTYVIPFASRFISILTREDQAIGGRAASIKLDEEEQSIDGEYICSVCSGEIVLVYEQLGPVRRRCSHCICKARAFPAADAEDDHSKRSKKRKLEVKADAASSDSTVGADAQLQPALRCRLLLPAAAWEHAQSLYPSVFTSSISSPRPQTAHAAAM